MKKVRINIFIFLGIMLASLFLSPNHVKAQTVTDYIQSNNTSSSIGGTGQTYMKTNTTEDGVDAKPDHCRLLRQISLFRVEMDWT